VFRLAAAAEGDAEVVSWADVWLSRRRPLIEAVFGELEWFVRHPRRALANAKSPVSAAAVPSRASRTSR
jgi:hypothetical protein